MDLSEKYIIMCQKAYEIQKNVILFNYDEHEDILRNGYFGEEDYDIYCPKCKETNSKYDCGEYCSDCGTKTKEIVKYEVKGYYEGNKENLIWLPRQDDLQEMLTREQLINLGRLTFICDNNTIHARTMGWIQNGDIVYIGESQIGYFTGDTMEQLWLQIVMKAKYSKLWNENKQEWLKCH